MADIKAVFFDIDGTLVPFGERGMRPETAEALHRLRAGGIKVFINSGRPKYYMNNLGDFPFDGYVCMNGGLLLLDGKVVWSRPIDREDALAVIRVSDENGLSCVAFGLDSFKLNFHSRKEIELSRMLGIDMGDTGPLEPLIEGGEDIYEFTVFADREEEKLFHFPVTKHLIFPRWNDGFMDVDPDSTSKADGIRMMASAMGIDISQTMAFGDGGNDISMLSAAGIGVAMGNASPEVQAHASYTTSSDTENGIPAALRHFGLI